LDNFGTYRYNLKFKKFEAIRKAIYQSNKKEFIKGMGMSRQEAEY